MAVTSHTEYNATAKQIATLKTRQMSLGKAAVRLGHENGFLGVRAQSIVRSAHNTVQKRIAQLEARQSDPQRLRQNQ